MKANKLFNVLVLGGALLTANAAPAMDHDEDEDWANPVFCNPDDPNICVDDGTGKLVPKKGLVCCWGTSCEASWD